MPSAKWLWQCSQVPLVSAIGDKEAAINQGISGLGKRLIREGKTRRMDFLGRRQIQQKLQAQEELLQGLLLYLLVPSGEHLIVYI